MIHVMSSEWWSYDSSSKSYFMRFIDECFDSCFNNNWFNTPMTSEWLTVEIIKDLSFENDSQLCARYYFVEHQVAAQFGIENTRVTRNLRSDVYSLEVDNEDDYVKLMMIFSQ